MVLVIMLMVALLAPLSTSASASASTATARTRTRADTFHIDPNDPRFIAVADEIDRRIIESLEKIVEGLRQSRDALQGLQQASMSTSASSIGSSSGSTGANAAATALQDSQLQNSIARALDKVETVLHGGQYTRTGRGGRGEGQGDGEEKATVADVAVDGDTPYMGAKSKDSDNHVYSDEILAESWVALSFGLSSNSTVTTAAATISSTS